MPFCSMVKVMNDSEILVLAMVQACKKYTDEVVDKVEKEIKKIGEETFNEVKENAPVSDTIYKEGGTYQRSFRKKTFKNSYGIDTKIFASGKNVHLTHLLEYGHLNRDGTTRAKAFPHIIPARKKAENKVDKFLEKL